MATVPSFFRVERNDILTPDPLSQCLFGLTADTQVGVRAVAPTLVTRGVSPSVYQTSVAISPLIILRVSVKQSFKEWEEAGTHVLHSRRK